MAKKKKSTSTFDAASFRRAEEASMAGFQPAPAAVDTSDERLKTLAREAVQKPFQTPASELTAAQRAGQRATLSTQLAASAARLDELLSKAEADMKAITEAGSKIKTNAQIEEEVKATAAEAVKAEAEGDRIIQKGVISGVIPYEQVTGTVFAPVVNAAPEYKTPSAAGLTAAVSILSSVGVDGLVDIMEQIRNLYPEISSEDALTLLKFDKRFNAPYLKRFSGNKKLMDAGFAPLDDKTYLATEQAYDKIFTAYGLNQFKNFDRYSNLIGNRISADELTTRVSTAYDRIVMGAGETKKALQQLYPEITDSDVLAYAIDPINQLPAIQRKIQAAEIGGAALAQNLTFGLQGAPEAPTAYTNVSRKGLGIEELMNQGVDLAEARRGYQAVAEVLPTAEKLSSIYGSRMDQYGRLEAEQEEFKGLASAKRARQKLRETEIAAFSGTSGLGRTSLSQMVGGQFQNPERTGRPRQSIRPIVGATPSPRMEVRPATNYEQKGGCYEQRILG